MNDSKEKYAKECEVRWNKKLISCRNLLKYLSKLNPTIDNNHEFNIDKARMSYYPKVRVFETTLIDCVDSGLIVSGLKEFSLMGNNHTIKSFKEKVGYVE
jgi:hypothetical protein